MKASLGYFTSIQQACKKKGLHKLFIHCFKVFFNSPGLQEMDKCLAHEHLIAVPVGRFQFQFISKSPDSGHF